MTHIHTDECWEPDSGCDMGRNEKFVALTPGTDRNLYSNEMTLEQAYEAGWVVCSDWARRDDLVADIGSPAYLEDRSLALGPKCNRGSNETCEHEWSAIRRVHTCLKGCGATMSATTGEVTAPKAKVMHKCKGCGAEGEPGSPDFCSADCFENYSNTLGKL